MTFHRLVGFTDLNPRGTLHGGILSKWIDEDAGTHAYFLAGGPCVTRLIREIDITQASKPGDVLSIETELLNVGRSSLEISASVVNVKTGQQVARCSGIVFVHVGDDYKPKPHGLNTP